jgi:hypothetical protein
MLAVNQSHKPQVEKLTLLIVPGPIVVGNLLSCPDIFSKNQSNIFISGAPLDLCKWPVVREIDEG